MQGQQLPFNPTQIQVQPIQVAIGQPPFVPMVNVPQQIQQWVPLIASIIVMEIQNKMQMNPLRIFMFNQYAQNGYNNPVFSELVEICANYIHLSLMHGREYTDPQHAALGIVPNIVTMMAGAQIKPFPALQQFLQPDQMQAAINGAKALEVVVRDIMQHVQGQRQMGYGQQQMQGGQFGGFATGGYGGYGGASRGGPAVATMAAQGSQSSGLFAQPNTHTGYPQTFSQPDPGNASATAQTNRYLRQLQNQHGVGGSQPDPQPSAQPTGYSYATGPAMNPASHVPPPSAAASHKTVADLIGDRGQVQQPFQPRDPAVMSEMSGQPAVAPAPVPQYQQPQAQQQVEVMEVQPSRWLSQETTAPTAASSDTAQEVTLYTEESLPAGLKWSRSAQQPYHPAWNPRKQKLLYTVLDNGTVLAVVAELSESEKKMMEYSKHAIGVTPVDRPAVVSDDKPESAIVDHELKAEDVKVTIEDTTTMVDCERSAHLHALVRVKIGEKLKDVDAYTIRMAMASPLLCEAELTAERYRDVLDELGRGRTFKDARRIIGDLNHTEELALRTYLNRLLTEELNSVLGLEMGLTGVTIDDFLDDSEPLDQALRAGYGDDLADKLKGKEGYIIERSLSAMPADEAKDLAKTMIGDVEGFDAWKGEVIYLTSLYTYTHIKAYAYELEVAGKAGEALLVSEGANLKLFTIINKVLEGANDTANRFRRNYLVTADGVKFEAARGFLNKDALLIRQVPASV